MNAGDKCSEGGFTTNINEYERKSMTAKYMNWDLWQNKQSMRTVVWKYKKCEIKKFRPVQQTSINRSRCKYIRNNEKYVIKKIICLQVKTADLFSSLGLRKHQSFQDSLL